MEGPNPLLDGTSVMGCDPAAPFWDAKLFGVLDLGALEVQPLDEGDGFQGGDALQRLSLHDSNAPENGFSGKRGRGDDDGHRGAASNKMANTEPGDPVPLPAYGQNVFVGKDLTVTRDARSMEQQLRGQVEECLALEEAEEAARRTQALRQALGRGKEWAEAAQGQDIWRPGTLAVLGQLQLLLGELEARLEVAEAARQERPPAECCRLIIMQQDLGCPAFLKDAAGGATLKLVAAPGLALVWPPRDVAARSVFEDGAAADVKLKLAGKPVAAAATQTIAMPSVSFEKGSRNRMVHLVFSCQLRLRAGGAAFVLVSPPSRPLVVTTSKKQWAPALGCLVARELFGAHRETVSHAAVANCLQQVSCLLVLFLSCAHPRHTHRCICAAPARTRWTRRGRCRHTTLPLCSRPTRRSGRERA